MGDTATLWGQCLVCAMLVPAVLVLWRALQASGDRLAAQAEAHAAVIEGIETQARVRIRELEDRLFSAYDAEPSPQTPDS